MYFCSIGKIIKLKNFINRIFENHSLIFKLIVYVIAVIAIVYLFPRNGQFKYQFQKGSQWQYDDFYAPFDFAIYKNENEILAEKQQIENNRKYFFTSQDTVYQNIKNNLFYEGKKLFSTETPNFIYGLHIAEKTIEKIYQVGFVEKWNDNVLSQSNDFIVELLNKNEATAINFKQLYNYKTVNQEIEKAFKDFENKEEKNKWTALLKKLMLPNVYFDKKTTDNFNKNQIEKILPVKGFIEKGALIISNGAVIENSDYEKLSSINREFDQQIWGKQNRYRLLISYIILVAITLMMLFLFINKYRFDIGENITKITFLLTNIFLMVLATKLILQYNSKYLYVIPFTLMPLLIKAILDSRLGLFTYVLTILLIGFIVPNNFEFVFIQIITGIVTILTVSELNKRANIFLTVGKIIGVYILTYIAFTVTHEGNLANVASQNIYLFILNGLLTASLIIPMIFIFEKTFGLTSDETLREFSDTNHKLLRELNEKAPGTFQHSMQVANLAEDACKEIGANALFARTGAMYHDIGKMHNPMYFVENQTTGVNPHSELDPEESARIIIDHVVLGIELAKKYNLPDRLIDFIRTHHGTNLVYYFYKKEEEYNPDATDINKFRYPGPIPFSKETAVVMICDACEAASKSLKEPTAKTLDLFVDKIVKGQMENGQFQNADITFREIEKVKKVVKKKLKNIHHIRIEYPE
jgi:putative nucleotidyltransferase with HDIG domain